jgi:hypothetical protein
MVQNRVCYTLNPTTPRNNARSFASLSTLQHLDPSLKAKAKEGTVVKANDPDQTQKEIDLRAPKRAKDTAVQKAKQKANANLQGKHALIATKQVTLLVIATHAKEK